MTAAQKNAYLEAHMAVQQHMQQAAMQINKHHQQQQQQHNQSLQRNDANNQQQANGQSHQSPSGISSTQHYANTIKVN